MKLMVPAGRHDPMFIHGFAGEGGHWTEVRELLEPSSRGIAIDLAGHGTNLDAAGPYTVERCAQDVIGKIPHAGALLVGHSMGTRIALEAAVQAPELVFGLVLVDGSNAPAAHANIANEMRSAIKQRGATAAMTEIMTGFLLDGIRPDRRMDLLRKALRLSVEAAIAYWASMAAWDTTRFTLCLSQVSCPVVVLQSTSLVQSDGLERHLIGDVPESLWLDAWHRSGKAHITHVPHCGHYTMIEQPGVVANAVSCGLS